jgi:PAS domain S-box-containing protein
MATHELFDLYTSEYHRCVERREPHDVSHNGDEPLHRREEPVRLLVERLRESEEGFRLLVDSIRDYAIFMLDPSGRVMSWNAGAERIKGYKAAEIIGHHFSRFYTIADIEAEEPGRALRDAMRHGSTEKEGWRVRKDGSRFWANVVITALFDVTGEHRGFAKITRDLTQRRQIEALEQTNRRVNEFLAMLAHELRNPLAPIRNAISVMHRAGTMDATAAWARDVIDRQTTHLTRLVDDLLDISRITSGKITLRCQPVDVNEVVARAVEVARPIIDQKHHALTVIAAPQPVMVDADATRLAQIIVNLLNNAAKYTPEHGRIRLSVASDEEIAIATVQDNGVGIPPPLLPHVFDLFAQGDRSTGRSDGGLGIGLSLARRLVELHRGTIHAKSDGPDLGSEFTMRLPLLHQLPPAASKGGTGEAADAAVRRVLVVDDNEDSALTMVMLLEVAGHKAKVAHDGVTALTLAREFKPHVVLLDIALPEMNGYEVAQRMRMMPELSRAVLVAMTGYGQDEDRRRSADAGFSEHLVKPIDPSALERVIASAEWDG